MADKVLEIKGVHKYFEDAGKRINVLDGVDLSMEAGDFFVLLGHSGSGKSTLLHIIGMLDEPSAGKVFVDGHDVLSLPEEERAVIRRDKIGYVFQFDSLLPEFSMLENVDMPALLAGRPDNIKSLEALSHLGIAELSHKMPSELSGGEKQRAAIARALRNKPRIVLADEPTGNLDEGNTAIVLEDFRKLAASGVAVLMVTHNQKAGEYATKVFQMEHGKPRELAGRRRSDILKKIIP